MASFELQGLRVITVVRLMLQKMIAMTSYEGPQIWLGYKEAIPQTKSSTILLYTFLNFLRCGFNPIFMARL